MEQLHEHNQRTYENICRMYDEGIQRVAVVQPTGSGKSLLMAKLIEDNPDSRFFILSTSHKINDQFKSKLDEGILERLNFNIYCNMPNMKQETMEGLQPDYILLDEMHRALAKEWSKGIKRLLEMYPDAKVLGLSATPIRYLDRCRNVVNELFNGNLACDMSLSQAILDGILPMVRYVCGVYSFQKNAESLNKKIEKSCNSDEEKKELLKELKVLKENLDKANGVSDIFKKYIVNGNEKFVVFLKNTAHLREMKPVIEKWFIDAGFDVRMYEVHCKNADSDKEFQAFKEDTEDGIIKLCLSIAMVTEGIHGDIDGVIMLRDTISPNMYFQMIGRAFSCGKKTIPLIFDLVANSQFISDAADNFPNELRGEIEKRKKECEKEGKNYEVDFDVDEFIVMDYFMDVVSGFKAIEGKLEGDWENGLKHFDKYVREHDGNVIVPKRYIDDDGFPTGSWVLSRRRDFKNKQLSPHRIQVLEKRGFVWDVFQYNFENNIKALKQYKERTGDCNVPYDYIEIVDGIEMKLGQWCQNIKKKKSGMNKSPLTEDQEKQLLQLGFVWDKVKYRFECNVNQCIEFYEKNGRRPSASKKRSEEEQKLGVFWNLNSCDLNLPNWKIDLLEKIPNFFVKINTDSVENFYNHALAYKEKYGNLDIKKGDVLDGYDLYQAYYNLKDRKNNLTLEQIVKLKEIGIDLNVDKVKEKYNEKICLAQEAIEKGIVINNKRRSYKGVNFYNFKNTHIKSFTKEELDIINRLVPNKVNKRAINIITVRDDKILATYESINEAGRALYNDFHIVDSENQGITIIQKRLRGETKNSIYKGGLRFEYANDRISYKANLSTDDQSK